MEKFNGKNQTDFRNINNKDAYYFNCYVTGLTAATVSNYPRFVTLNNPIQIIRVTEIHESIATVGSPTLDVVAVDDGQAISAGTSVLITPFDLSASSNTNQTREKFQLVRNMILEPGQSLALLTSGTLTSVAGVLVTVYYQPYAKGSYK